MDANPRTDACPRVDPARRAPRPPRPRSVSTGARSLGRWTELLTIAARHPHVLVHGDIHEDQLLASGGHLTGILDWETAASTIRSGTSTSASGVPACGAGTGRSSRSCGRTRGARTRTRAVSIRVPSRSRPCSGCGTLLALLDEPGDPAVAGTVDEHLNNLQHPY